MEDAYYIEYYNRLFSNYNTKRHVILTDEEVLFLISNLSYINNLFGYDVKFYTLNPKNIINNLIDISENISIFKNNDIYEIEFFYEKNELKIFNDLNDIIAEYHRQMHDFYLPNNKICIIVDSNFSSYDELYNYFTKCGYSITIDIIKQNEENTIYISENSGRIDKKIV